ncbi:MAG: L,D-transpeptidase [bacterium]
MIKNVIYIIAGMLVFFIGMITYGIILNIREVTLKEAMDEIKLTRLNNVYLVVNRKKYRLELYSDSVLVKSYKAVFGKNTGTEKRAKDDYITPIGEYKICSIDTASKFHKLFQINYPNEKDATEAFRNNYISKRDFFILQKTWGTDDCPAENTPINTVIGIHGMGRFNFIFKNLPFSFNWTNGSVSVSDESVDELYPIIKIGTKVSIVY